MLVDSDIPVRNLLKLNIRFRLSWNQNNNFNFRTIGIRMLYIYKFPLTPMGVLAPGSAHTRPSTDAEQIYYLSSALYAG